MKKISIFLALVALVMTLFAINVFAASFTRGPENTKITLDHVALNSEGEPSIELMDGSALTGGWGFYFESEPVHVLDGDFNTTWMCTQGGRIRITLENEWEITSLQALHWGNHKGIKIVCYAADGKTIIAQLEQAPSNGKDWNWVPTDGNPNTDWNSMFSNVSYGDNDKAIKYIDLIHTGFYNPTGPRTFELYIFGRERTPSVGCDSHVFKPVYEPAPTCTAPGFLINTCEKCGAKEAAIEVPALGHKIGDYTIIADPTCIKAPKIEYVCANGCGETLQTEANFDDVTDNYVPYSEKGHSGGGYSYVSIFDNNMDTCSLAPDDWYTSGSVELDRAYYISSATVWVGNARYDSVKNTNTTIILYYQVPNSDEWIEAGRTAGNGTYMSVKYEYILELDEPVYADAVMVRVEGLESWNGCVWEAKVSGSLVEDVATGHTWQPYETVAPDCDDFGYTNYICTVCDAEKKSDPVEETGHTWVDATCIAPKTCTLCAATEGDVGAHLYDDNANDATCNREGCDYVRGIARIGDKYFATLADAFNAAVEGNEIVVLDKIVVEGEATWNLTGKTITFVNSPADNYAVVVKGDLTIVGGTYNVTGYFGFGVTGKLTVNGGTFVAETADYLIGSWGTTTINGGSFKANYNCVNAFAGSVVINGGNFKVIDVDNAEWPAQDVFGEDAGEAVIYGGTFSTDIYAYLAETYHIDLDENGKYVAAPTIHVDAKAATCTTNGNVEYWYCETCELVWVDKALTRISNFKSVVTPAAHGEAVIKEEIKPTCTDPGSITKVCADCGEVVSTETLAPVAHTVEHVAAKAATCDEPGNIEYWYCTVCGFAWLDEACTLNTNLKAVVLPIAHNVEHVEASESTCTENGNIEYWYCTECGYAWLDEACTLNTNLKAVVLPAGHVWSETPEEITPATCIETGVGKYFCINCNVYDEERGEIEMPIDPTAHADMIFNDAYTFATCPDCGAYAFYGTHKGIGENDLIWMFMENKVNIYNNDSFDVYYNTVLAYSEETGYTVTLVAKEDGDTTYDGSVATIKINEDGTLLITLGNLVFGKDPSATEDLSSKLNGTYQYIQDDMVIFEFVLKDGKIIWTVRGGEENDYETTYTYDGNKFECALALSLNDGVLVYNFGGTEYPLTLYVEAPVEPEKPNYGVEYGSMTVTTTDTYGPFDLYSYTAQHAGKYSFFIPAGLGVVDKAAVEEWGVTPIFELDYFENTEGTYVSIELDANETLSFYIIATTKADWTIDIYYLCDHVEETIPAILPTPSTTGYTAGIKCSNCGEYIVKPQVINVTTTPGYKIFGINSTNLILGNNISLDYKVNVSEGYGTPYMVFVFEGVEYIVTDYEIDGGKPVFNFAETRPHKIATNVEAYVYAETADGYTVDKYDYSVMKYCISKLKKNESVEVISDLLVFGAETQKYVASMTNTTVADEDLITSIVEAQGYTLKPSTFTSIPEALKAQYVDVDANDDLTWKSSTVVLGSSTEMVYKFAANDITGLYIKIEVDGVQKMMIDAADLEYDAAAKRYVVSVNCVSAVQYGSEVKATFVKNGVESDSVAYSINGFLYNNLAKNEGTVLGNLMKALYLYGNTTYNYFYNN